MNVFMQYKELLYLSKFNGFANKSYKFKIVFS